VIQPPDHRYAPEPLVLQRSNDALGHRDGAMPAHRAESLLDIPSPEQVAEHLGGEHAFLVGDDVLGRSMPQERLLQRLPASGVCTPPSPCGRTGGAPPYRPSAFLCAPTAEQAIYPAAPQRERGVDAPTRLLQLERDRQQPRVCTTASAPNSQAEPTRFCQNGVRWRAGDRACLPNPPSARGFVHALMSFCGLQEG